MPTTTMAVSNPLTNPTSTVTTQVSSIKDDVVTIISSPPPPQQQQLQSNQNHDSSNVVAIETAQLLSSPITTSSSNGDDDSGDIIKATVNGNNNNINVKNGAISNLLTGEQQLQQQQQHGSHSPISIGSSTISSSAAVVVAATLSSSDIVDVDLNIKTASDINCLNIVTSSSPTSTSVSGGNHFLNGSNGHLLMAQNSSLNFQATTSPDNNSPWSIGDENSSMSGSGGGGSGFVNYSSPNSGHHHQQQQQLHKRPIMSQQMHHGLSPNSSIARNSASQQQQQQQQQQYIHYNKNNGNSGGNNNNNFSAWSNHSGPNSPWQQQQQQQQMQLLQSTSSSSSSQMSMNAWNRRSAPNLNPLSPHVMQQHQHHQQQQPHQRKHQNATQFSMPSSASSSQPQGLSPNLTSPSKYRRSTSYPGKNHMHAFQMDVGNMIEDQSSYMNYQDRNSMDMRSLEHCLNDITNTAGVQSDLKGFLNSTTTLQSLAQLQGKLDFHEFHEFIPGKPFYQCEDTAEETGGNFLDGNNLQIGSPARSSPSQGSDNGERFSRKVFVGGLPPDIDEDEITSSFRRYGPLVVDWPHKAESKSYFPPKGYAFLLFQDESSVQTLIENCIVEEDKLYICVSSPTIKNKPVQIRPWRLSDADFVLNGSMPLDPRKTVFVGGVPRPLKALELAMIMDRLYGGVCYAGIDTDPELKYPKGAGRVAFSNQQSYIAAISARFVQLQHNDIDKRVEVKPYVLDDQMCDECQGQRCSGKFAPFFCANVTCLQYYCEHCWATIHSRPGREYHKPLVKEGADRPRAVPFRWC